MKGSPVYSAVCAVMFSPKVRALERESGGGGGNTWMVTQLSLPNNIIFPGKKKQKKHLVLKEFIKIFLVNFCFVFREKCKAEIIVLLCS